MREGELVSLTNVALWTHAEGGQILGPRKNHLGQWRASGSNASSTKSPPWATGLQFRLSTGRNVRSGSSHVKPVFRYEFTQRANATSRFQGLKACVKPFLPVIWSKSTSKPWLFAVSFLGDCNTQLYVQLFRGTSVRSFRNLQSMKLRDLESCGELLI